MNPGPLLEEMATRRAAILASRGRSALGASHGGDTAVQTVAIPAGRELALGVAHVAILAGRPSNKAATDTANVSTVSSLTTSTAV